MREQLIAGVFLLLGAAITAGLPEIGHGRRARRRIREEIELARMLEPESMYREALERKIDDELYRYVGWAKSDRASVREDVRWWSGLPTSFALTALAFTLAFASAAVWLSVTTKYEAEIGGSVTGVLIGLVVLTARARWRLARRRRRR